MVRGWEDPYNFRATLLLSFPSPSPLPLPPNRHRPLSSILPVALRETPLEDKPLAPKNREQGKR